METGGVGGVQAGGMVYTQGRPSTKKSSPALTELKPHRNPKALLAIDEIDDGGKGPFA